MFHLSLDEMSSIKNSPKPSIALLVFLCRPTREGSLWLRDIPMNLELLCRRSGKNCVVCPKSACLISCLHIYQFGLPPDDVLVCRSVIAARMLYKDYNESTVSNSMLDHALSYSEYAQLWDELVMLKTRLKMIGTEYKFCFSWHKTIDLYPWFCHAFIMEIVADWKALYTAIYGGSGFNEGGVVRLRMLTGPTGQHHGLRPIRNRLVRYLATSVLYPGNTAWGSLEEVGF